MCQSLEALVLEKNVGMPSGMLRLFESRNRHQPEGLPRRRRGGAKRPVWANQGPRGWCRSTLRIAQFRTGIIRADQATGGVVPPKAGPDTRDGRSYWMNSEFRHTGVDVRPSADSCGPVRNESDRAGMRVWHSGVRYPSHRSCRRGGRSVSPCLHWPGGCLHDH